MSRHADLAAAIAKQAGAIARLAGAKPSAKRDQSLQINAGTLVKYAKELETLPAPGRNPDPDLFLGDSDDQTVTIQGGSPGNPNGVTFTVGDAIRWWGTVFSERVNYSHVRPTLLPGSKVLTDAGRAAAVALTQDPTATVAEADYNPLGLPIIP